MTYGFIDTVVKSSITILTNVLTLEICESYNKTINYKFKTSGSM